MIIYSPYYFLPHMRSNSGGKVIGVGVPIYIYICVYIYNIYDCEPKKSYFSDRLTFSNIRGRTSHQIYRLALPLLSPETLSSSSKSRIFLYIAHLALFVWKDDTFTQLKYNFRHRHGFP